MRAGIRILLAVAMAGLLAGVAWAGGLFYWHYRVEKVIRYLEDAGEDCAFQPGMEATLIQAGCRALPPLVRATHRERPVAFLSITTNQIVWLLNRDPVLSTDDCALRTQRRKDFLVEPTDPAPVRRAKVDRLQAWWSQHGPEMHQWWRFWTANCRDPE
ncbi:MAG TPA: hypothetical protein VKW04_02840 [Planctomycetota bacterium]|nr:hypothetical protein [Planctomycetota bacterium]